ncbi:AraC family transcriptional regulator [Pseudomonas toyotomiensis]|uniref:AraC family transcriptional regulator n=1 Tax=Ectopseudomonas toyotomiensis TaxID=554344 RepID=A0AA42INX7_9GAMM|nr:AraC family transcriptional regulator [Pseudomonas toyotomiensis]MDH0703253.1 AraC family transcriptional regulator [Pseudomonas toyotomiensis]
MTAEPTTLASWTRALRKQLDALGLDSAALCSEAGLDPAVLDDPNARCPLSVTTRLWQLAVAASGDPALGLKTSQFVSPTTFHALGYALIASSSLREMFERIVRYHRVVSDALQLELRELEDVYEFRFRVPPGSPAPAPEALDAFAAIYVRSCRNRLNREFSPLLVQLQRPQPTDPAPWQAVFRAPLQFDAEESLLRFPRAAFEQRLDDGNPELAEHNETVLRRNLEQLQAASCSERVRTCLEAQLPDGEPSAERIAQALHLSLRSLQRHLAEEGTSYEALLGETRHVLALRHMRDPRCSISEIAYLLGFSDSSSFGRAFKRWTGQTPSQYRDGFNNA